MNLMLIFYGLHFPTGFHRCHFRNISLIVSHGAKAKREAGGRANQESGDRISNAGGLIGGVFEKSKSPAFISNRLLPIFLHYLL